MGECVKKIVLAAALLAIATSVSANPISGTPKIIDGDTLRFGYVSIRMFGIDAAEVGQTCKAANGKRWRCADAAMDRLGELIAEGVTCEGNQTDGYGRILATCYRPDRTDINKQLVEEGLAWAFRRYSDTYNDVEDAAKAKGHGIWQAETQTPWDYRAARWEVAEQEAPSGCPIKGNINSHNERIYHPPWSPWYNKTKVDLAKGERWFCSEKEAVEAGWRAPAWR
jgi:endonuclease YncB( thermonuclease family)